MEQKYKYFAFISYSSKDYKWGKCVQRRLEGYRMPATLCSEHGWKRKPINPVFFAPTDIQPGPLTDELKARLIDSKHLIVICSSNSAQSDWVGQEIEYFYKELGRKNIHFFIVDGTPHTGDKTTECFNPIVEKLGMPEILGANIHEHVSRWSWINKERAYVQLITKLLGVEFDSIWQRHRRMLIEKLFAWCIGILVVLSVIIGVWLANQPIDVKVSLNEVSVHNDNLPPLRNAIVTLVLDNENKTDTFARINQKVFFKNIPANKLGKEVKVHFSSENWCAYDTIIKLNKSFSLNVSRDVKAFGHVHFTLYDQQVFPVANKSIMINGIELRSNKMGVVDTIISLEKQSTIYRLTSLSVALQDTLIDAKCGDNEAVFIK